MSDHRHREPLNSGFCADTDSIDFDQVMVIPDTPDRISKQSENICKISSPGDASLGNRVRDSRLRLFGCTIHPAESYTHPGGDAARRQGANSSAVLLSNSRNVRASNVIPDKTVTHKDGHHCYNLEMEDDRISSSGFGGISSHHHRIENPVSVEHDIPKRSPNIKKHDIGAPKTDKDHMLSGNGFPSHTAGVSSKSTRNHDKGKVKVYQNLAPSHSRNDKGNIKVVAGHDEPMTIHSNAPCVKGNDNFFPIASDHDAEKDTSVHSRLRKRLVRNGCISPHNITKAKRVESTSGIGSQNGECPVASGGSHPVIDVSEVSSKNNAACRAKGKGLLIHDSSSNGHASRRNDSGYSTNEHHKGKFHEDCIILRDTRDNSNKDGTGRNTTKFPSTLYEDKFMISEVPFRTPSSSFKRPNKSSGNSEKNTEVICLSSGGKSSTVKSLRDHSGFPVREVGSSSAVGDISPEVGESISQTNNDSDAREIQLKADEMLARELQEQLYNETPFFTGGENISSLGRAEQREDSLQAAYIHRANNASIPSLGGAEQREAGRQAAYSIHRANGAGISSLGEAEQQEGSLQADFSIRAHDDFHRALHAHHTSISSLGGAEQQEDGLQAALSIHHAHDDFHRAHVAIHRAHDDFHSSFRAQPPQQSLRSRLFRRGPPARQSRSYSSWLRSLPSSRTERRRFFAPDMDIHMRMHLLESMEAMYFDNISVVDQFINSDREFGENDYEMLLALDENNHAHLGASVAQIASLPESTVNNDNYETCSICLENPVIGETIRHLPCLHKFHKDCIDPWLRRKRSCPICKSDI